MAEFDRPLILPYPSPVIPDGSADAQAHADIEHALDDLKIAEDELAAAAGGSAALSAELTSLIDAIRSLAFALRRHEPEGGGP